MSEIEKNTEFKGAVREQGTVQIVKRRSLRGIHFNDCRKKREIPTDSSVLGTELVTDISLKSEGYFNCLHQGCNTNLTKKHPNSYPIPSMYVMDGIFTD